MFGNIKKFTAQAKALLRMPTYKKIVTSKENNIFEIDYDSMYSEGIRVFVFDVDETLTGFKEPFTEESKQLLKELSQKGFKLALFSNCSKKRFNELKFSLTDIDVFIMNRSDKPRKDGYLEILAYYRELPEKAAMIGDQVLTDLVGAYDAGFKYRILVDQFSGYRNAKKSYLLQRMSRKAQKIFV